MSEAPNRRMDGVIYGAALVFALVGGAAAVADRWGAPEEGGAAAAPRVEAPAAVDASTAPAPPAPALPEVPDLDAVAPDALPPSDDPRAARLGAEMRLLSHARELLEHHPSEAFGVLESHRRRFPNGMLREEREAFAIEALDALEHPREAERRYFEFTRDFPDSAFRARLARIMRGD